ncbi:hypothetical protein [Salinicola tamaricis]|uniref:hypothetical protein n=1 Tax=Salinicola tamaricis TaxID=1771309 RepID=UPI001F5C2256|nr:hypothetical protein [Salinicola tamaricis]
MALLLAVMTLLTFFYVVVTNLYNVFYDLGDAYPALETPAFAVGDWLLGIGQEMTWSLAMTTTIFAWLIFLASPTACASARTSASICWCACCPSPGSVPAVCSAA